MRYFENRSDKKLIVLSCLLIIAEKALFELVPSRMALISWLGQDLRQILPLIDLALPVVGVALDALLFGSLAIFLLRDILSQGPLSGAKVLPFGSSLRRALIVFAIAKIGMTGLGLAFAGLEKGTALTFLATFLTGLWSTLTFTLYPTFILDTRDKVFSALKRSFSVATYSWRHWAGYFLVLFLLTGGLTIFPGQAPFSGSSASLSDQLGWHVHIHWLGGFYQEPFWYTDFITAFSLTEIWVIKVLFIAFNVLVSTAIHYKVAEILIRLGLISIEKRMEVYGTD